MFLLGLTEAKILKEFRFCNFTVYSYIFVLIQFVAYVIDELFNTS
jgi:hypothetical protein